MKLFFFTLFVSAKLILVGNQQFILFTSLYEESNPIRQEEFLECLERNITNPYIKKINVFFERKGHNCSFEQKIINILTQSNKLTIEYISSRPTFEFYFNIANTIYPNEKIIIANGDIFFDSTLSMIPESLLKNCLIALTRYNIDENNHYILHDNKIPYSPSQDTWIFKSPIIDFFSDIQLGKLGCDPAIAYWAYKAGLKICNPSLTIKTYHLHSSNLRTYSIEDSYDRIHSYLALKQCSIDYCVKSKRKNLIKIERIKNSF